ncbi:lipocalin family protein [Sulfurimonas sp. HSL3-7]|uniref:lipocalin family protein n=1 Tax=Sulfonitrofixus jiaomeiensis TaxID=3131938 RepID=UPI0031FA251A
MRVFYAIFLLIPLFFFTACGTQSIHHLQSVESVDQQRFSTTWNVLAYYKNIHNSGCVGSTLTYRYLNNALKLTRNCYDGSGRLKREHTAEIKLATASDTSKFDVYYNWFEQYEQWIIMLASDYRYSVIASPDRKRLWILSKGTVLDPADREHIFAGLSQNGFDTAKLYWTGFQAACNAKSIH